MKIEAALYQPPDISLWQGRTDSLPNERFFQTVHCINPSEIENLPPKSTVLLGFASDAGVTRNLGRPGAKLGPNAIRKHLARLPNHSKISLYDLGNIECNHDNLEDSQSEFATLISRCHAAKHSTIALGGGHEIAWGHFQGLSPHYPRLGIINFDAHFDLRPYQAYDRATSGTPFSQIALYCQQNNLAFNYCCLGIQPLGNTQSLFDSALQHQVSYLTAEAIYCQPLSEQKKFLDDFMNKHDHIYLTICLDVFASCFAPGVSAPQTLGIHPWQALKLLKYIQQSGKVVSLDIAELSPPLDEGEKTANLAAMLVAELL